MNAYHFCAEYQESPGVTHVFSGVLTADVDPFNSVFYSRLVADIAKEMTPPRPADRVVIRTLSLLASKSRPNDGGKPPAACGRSA